MKEETSEEAIRSLKDKGLTCSKLKSMINKQMLDAKRDRIDSQVFRNVGFEKQALFQEQIAKANEKSADTLRNIRKKLCPLK